MRTATITLITLSIAMLLIQCGGEPELPNALEHSRSRKMVRIGTHPVNPPFETGAGTGVQGFDVDIANEIVKDIAAELSMENLEARWITNFPFSHLFELLRNGEIEMIMSAVAITPEREKEFAFSDPYFESRDTIARRKDRPEINELADLTGKKVGVVEASSHEAFMESQAVATGVELLKVPSLDDALGALNRREIDAVVGDAPILGFSIWNSFSTNLITTDAELGVNRFGVAMRKSDPDLVVVVNKTISRLKETQELETLREKWFQDVLERLGGVREKLEQEEALKKSPKMVRINIIQRSSSDFDLSRLDGYQAQLVGSARTYTSAHILTNGRRGTIRFPRAIPTGEYSLKMDIMGISLPLNIEERISSSVTFDMVISNTISITERQ